MGLISVAYRGGFVLILAAGRALAVVSFFRFVRAFGVGLGCCAVVSFVFLALGLVLVAVVSFVCGAFWVWCCFCARVKLVLFVIQ